MTEDFRRWVFIVQHPPKYRRAASKEFRVPERMDTQWTEMVGKFVHKITKALALGGRHEW